MATQLGAVATVNATDSDAVAQIVEMTHGGAQVSVDALGDAPTALPAIECLRINRGSGRRSCRNGQVLDNRDDRNHQVVVGSCRGHCSQRRQREGSSARNGDLMISF